MSVPNLGAMRAVAARLEPLGIPYAFLGGSVVNLLLDQPELSPARPTDDVDVIIELAADIRYSDLEARLRGAGFGHNIREGAPKCRWILESLTVDIMPTDGAGIGLNTAWFAEALATAENRVIAHSCFRIISPVAFLATKYAAFCDRGNDDLYGSKDLEDFMTVVDGRAKIAEEVDLAAATLRGFVVAAVRSLWGRPTLPDALPGYLPRDQEARVTSLSDKLVRIAKLT